MRLNIEERAFGDYRRKLLAHNLGIKESYALGVLATLWHNSQEVGFCEGSQTQIQNWCEEVDPEDRNLIFSALVESGYLLEIEDGRFEIVGNRTQVEQIEKLRDRSKKGGDVTKEKFKKACRPSNLGLEASRKQGPMQFNTKQCNSRQSNADIKEKKEKKRKDSFLSSPHGEDALSFKKNIPKKWAEQITDFDRHFAERWFEFSGEVMPNAKFRREDFQVAVVKMRKEYNLTENEVQSVFEWCQSSSFWRDKSASPVGLVRRKQGKSSLDTILAQKSQQEASMGLSVGLPSEDEDDKKWKRDFIKRHSSSENLEGVASR